MTWAMAWLLAVAGAASAKDAVPPAWDCSVEKTQGNESWDADRYGVRWHTFTREGHYVAVSMSLYKPAQRAALQRHGGFDPALEASVTFGPPLPESKKPLWIALFAGSARLPLVPLHKYAGTYRTGSVALFDLEPLLAAAPDLRVYYVRADGTKMAQTSFPTAVLRAAVERFPEIAREYEAREANPEGQCSNSNDTIVVT